MKVVALLSGGKDSCYNIVQCIAAGHDVCALANLTPIGHTDEMDSYMFQTVGHESIDLIAQAMRLPLYRRDLTGQSLQQDALYVQTQGDEVETLAELLLLVLQHHPDIKGVSVGAILSDYQRVRVEHVCKRLGLTSLGYLWRRDQVELLTEMVDCGINAVLIKVAAMGLDPHKHLNKSLAQMKPTLLRLHQQYEVHPCGEGGEYESLTLDAPVFHSRIVLDNYNIIMHSQDAFAPVGYLRVKVAHLEDKPDYPHEETLVQKQARLRELLLGSCVNQHIHHSFELQAALRPNAIASQILDPVLSACLDVPPIVVEPTVCAGHDFIVFGNILGFIPPGSDAQAGAQHAFVTMQRMLAEHNVPQSNVLFVHWFLRDMSDFATLNDVYIRYFNANPPARACVQLPLPASCAVMMEVTAARSIQHQSVDAKFMHVQSISHWAPANIGPYSQAVKAGTTLFVAGQIGLLPGFMQLAPTLESQAEISLKNTCQVLEAFGSNFKQVIACICYISDSTTADKLESIRAAHDADQEEESIAAPALVIYVHVKRLPRDAQVEWQVIAELSEPLWHTLEHRTVMKTSNNGEWKITVNALTSEQHKQTYATVAIAYTGDVVKQPDADAWKWFCSQVLETAEDSPNNTFVRLYITESCLQDGTFNDAIASLTASHSVSIVPAETAVKQTVATALVYAIRTNPALDDDSE